jgi:DNA-binding GntR family transcriptional regulator
MSPSTTTIALSDDDIHQRLIEAIIDQRLPPGTRLGEDKLGQAFGVSRTRIRQVLIRLAQEQVVTLQPNKGASVAEPTVDEAREVFEAVLVQRFVARRDGVESALQALAECIEAEEAARQSGDQAMALRHSGNFHLLLADASGHSTFAGFLRKLVSRTSLILMSYAPVSMSRPWGQAAPLRWVHACRCDEHRGLLSALRQATSEPSATPKVVALMTEHLAHIEAGLCFSQPLAPRGALDEALMERG